MIHVSEQESDTMTQQWFSYAAQNHQKYDVAESASQSQKISWSNSCKNHQNKQKHKILTWF